MVLGEALVLVVHFVDHRLNGEGWIFRATNGVEKQAPASVGSCRLASLIQTQSSFSGTPISRMRAMISGDHGMLLTPSTSDYMIPEPTQSSIASRQVKRYQENWETRTTWSLRRIRTVLWSFPAMLGCLAQYPLLARLALPGDTQKQLWSMHVLAALCLGSMFLSFRVAQWLGALVTAAGTMVLVAGTTADAEAADHELMLGAAVVLVVVGVFADAARWTLQQRLSYRYYFSILAAIGYQGIMSLVVASVVLATRPQHVAAQVRHIMSHVTLIAIFGAMVPLSGALSILSACVSQRISATVTCLLIVVGSGGAGLFVHYLNSGGLSWTRWIGGCLILLGFVMWNNCWLYSCSDSSVTKASSEGEEPCPVSAPHSMVSSMWPSSPRSPTQSQVAQPSQKDGDTTNNPNQWSILQWLRESWYFRSMQRRIIWDCNCRCIEIEVLTSAEEEKSERASEATPRQNIQGEWVYVERRIDLYTGTAFSSDVMSSH
eukprot:Protomagalhaensia_sp_Gyna_25__610@NODE_1288_length_1980_cov_38_958269_g1027_i0_p1_GENE_NODE_1288_length_1980_cov_38_958269_g1027_i0NODE_1288_length_1980_cov_38_958269_g1027_i0_p1_ORF_typecomplete_len489_score49_06SLC35F/PF06027_12/0_02UAA/PF08449_11/0_031CRTlike/PF08627_10/0_01CRTlike/PF08627_10/3_9e03ABC_membrane_2/PF06472_15/0_072ABC_membrane_2/PF06472_15/2_5e03_NODE_1288_length_1980_cov_38_958269_g1027_i03261792